MGWLGRTLGSTIGQKWAVALSGIGLVGFVLGHMLGNLQVFLGPDALNSYAETLHSHMALLWVVRSGVFACFAVHVVLAMRLARRNQAARPVRYGLRKTIVSSFASRTMPFGGIALFLFVLYHLAHFTLGLVDPEIAAFTDAQGRPDVYRMVVHGFRDPVASGLYIAAMAALMLHLSHGVSSLLQTFGSSHPSVRRFALGLGPVVGILLFLGNISMPLAIFVGYGVFGEVP